MTTWANKLKFQVVCPQNGTAVCSPVRFGTTTHYHRSSFRETRCTCIPSCMHDNVFSVVYRTIRLELWHLWGWGPCLRSLLFSCQALTTNNKILSSLYLYGLLCCAVLYNVFGVFVSSSSPRDFFDDIISAKKRWTLLLLLIYILYLVYCLVVVGINNGACDVTFFRPSTFGVVLRTLYVYDAIYYYPRIQFF